MISLISFSLYPDPFSALSFCYNWDNLKGTNFNILIASLGVMEEVKAFQIVFFVNNYHCFLPLLATGL